VRHLKRIPLAVFPVLLVLAGFAATQVGLYLLLGLAPTLIAAGVAAVVAGLLVDV